MPNSMLSDIDIREQLARGNAADLSIANYCDECITPVGYDIRAGDTVFSYEGKEVKSLRDGRIDVLPGDTVFISSMESFKLSSKLGGFTVSRLGPQLDGLQLSALSVDPTWEGELLIILVNHGRKPVTIKHGDRLMTLCLFWMASPSSDKNVRPTWTANTVWKQFKAIEEQASMHARIKIACDVGLPLLLAIAFSLLRLQGKFETNVETGIFWAACVSLYFSPVRKIVLRSFKLPE